MALRKVLLTSQSLCLQSGITNLLVESLLVDDLQHESSQNAIRLENPVSKVRRLMSYSDVCLCQRVNRLGDCVAHKLARMA